MDMSIKKFFLIISVFVLVIFVKVSFSDNCDDLYNLAKKYANEDKNYYLSLKTLKKIDSNCPNYLKTTDNIALDY